MLSLLLLTSALTASISQDKVDFYKDNGYLVLPNFYSEKECDDLKNHVSQLLHDCDIDSIKSIFTGVETTDRYFFNSSSNTSFFFEKNAFNLDGSLAFPKELCINKMGHAMHDLDPYFNRFARAPQLAELTSSLGVKNPLLIQSMYIFKQPFIGSEVTCHQDSTFLISEPNTTIGYWVAIEDATKENGCLWVIPGEHTTPLKRLYVREGMKTHFVTYDEKPWNLDKLVPLEVKKGTLIVLHGHVPHMSLTNTSAKSRHAFTLHVVDASSDFPDTNWLQRDKSFPFEGF